MYDNLLIDNNKPERVLARVQSKPDEESEHLEVHQHDTACTLLPGRKKKGKFKPPKSHPLLTILTLGNSFAHLYEITPKY